MSDNEKQLYQPTVRPREREDSKAEMPRPVPRDVSTSLPESRPRPELLRIGFMMPTLYELPMVPGPDTVQ